MLWTKKNSWTGWCLNDAKKNMLMKFMCMVKRGLSRNEIPKKYEELNKKSIPFKNHKSSICYSPRMNKAY